MYPLTKQGEQKGLGANDIKRKARSRTNPLLFALRPPIRTIKSAHKKPPCVLHSKSIAFSRTPKAPDSV